MALGPFLIVSYFAAVKLCSHYSTSAVALSIATGLLYNKVMTTRTRLTTDQKLRALAYIARGDTLSQVAGHMLEEFEVTISESALSQLKKNHADTITKMQDSLSESAAEDADALLKKTRRMLSVRLDRADRDSRQDQMAQRIAEQFPIAGDQTVEQGESAEEHPQ